MKGEDLLFAMAAAEEADLEQSEQLPQQSVMGHRLLRIALLAAVISLLLCGTVFATVRLLLGKIEVQEQLVDVIIGQNRNYSISFSELSVNWDAPKTLETYYRPAVLPEGSQLSRGQCFVESETFCYYPFRAQEGGNLPLSEPPVGIHLEWETSDGDQITLDQLAGGSLDGHYDLNIQTGAEVEMTVNHKRMLIGQQEIFSFQMTIQGEDHREWTGQTWIWTDGSYLYVLGGGGRITEEEMEAMQQSLAPCELHTLLSENKEGMTE